MFQLLFLFIHLHLSRFLILSSLFFICLLQYTYFLSSVHHFQFMSQYGRYYNMIFLPAGLMTRLPQPESVAASPADQDTTTDSPSQARKAARAAAATSHEISQQGEVTTVKEVTDGSPTPAEAPSGSKEQAAAEEKVLEATVRAAQSQEILRIRTKSRPSKKAGAPPPPVERALFSYQDLFAARPLNVRASPPVQYGLNLSLARLNYEFSAPTGPTAVFAAAAANLASFRPPPVKKPSRMGIVGGIDVGEPVPVQAARHILIGWHNYFLQLLVITF
jgi:hypothetical protein